MKIPPAYQITAEILQLISKIDSYRLFFSSENLPSLIKFKIQRISLLKSALFSARIEGNPLKMDNFEFSEDEQKKIEVYNISSASEYVGKSLDHNQQLNDKLVLMIHSMIMKGLNVNAGSFRNELNAIFNQAGMAVYLPPPPEEIKVLLKKLFEYIRNREEKFPIIKALVSHLVFEKIHPFLDGNGRVGRILIYAVMKMENYDFGFYIPFEEYLDEHKSDYYHFLDVGMKQTNEYLIFMLTAFVNQLENLKNLIETEKNKKILLPPRQEEIFNIVKDHPLISFDFIRRRFLKIPSRTLRYDLKKLTDQKLVTKIGKTKGSCYKIIT